MSHQSLRYRRIASDVGISNLPCFVQIDCTVVQKVRLPGATDTAAACLAPLRSPSSGVSSVSGASTYSTAHGLNRILTVLATPSVSVPFHLQPRRVRSRCRVSPAGRFELYFCGQFSVCLFRIRGREPRSIFPLAKVGLTVQRKTGPPGLSS